MSRSLPTFDNPRTYGRPPRRRKSWFGRIVAAAGSMVALFVAAIVFAIALFVGAVANQYQNIRNAPGPVVSSPR